MNKNILTNLVAVIVVLIGNFLENSMVLMVGLFALSGSITNSLAIHMLFEKVPFMYGSGVISDRFEEFKLSISKLMMEQFFTKDNLSRFFTSEFDSSDTKFDFEPLIDKSDLTPAFDSLKSAVMESSFGGMLGMFGGEGALDGLKEPFEKKMKSALITIVQTKSFQNSLHQSLNSPDIADDIYNKVSKVVQTRLDEFTPDMVKNIIQDMIKEHLGWLVVWGGVVGGLLGFLGALTL
jgi:uncharacterized membrane protein YheB (UPF0754 family)